MSRKPLSRLGNDGFLLLVVCVLALNFLGLVPRASAGGEGWGEVTSLAILPDGKTAIAACQEDNKLRIYDVATGKERKTIDAHKSGTWAVAASPDGKWVATGGGDTLVKIWDAKTFKEIRSFAGHTKEILTLAFSPDCKVLASGGADRTIRTWDLESGKDLKVWHGHELKVLSLAFSPDGKTLASGGVCTAAVPGFPQGAFHADQVRLFDAQTGQEKRKLVQRGTTVCITPDGRAIASAGVIVTSIPRDGGNASVSRGTRAIVGPVQRDGDWMLMKGEGTALTISPSGRLLALGIGTQIHMARPQGKFGRNWIEEDAEHNRVSIWETATGKKIMDLPEAGVTVLAISPDERTIVVGTNGGKVEFHDLAPEDWPYKKKSPQLSAKELDKLWNSLSDEAPEAAYEAIWTLSAGGKTAVAFLNEKMEAEKPANDQAKELLVKLDSDKYAIREAAFRDLKKLGPTGEGTLRQALADKKTSVEVRKRVQNLLDSWEKRPCTSTELRQVRALEVLERIGTPESKAVLTRLAEGAPGAWLTDQARLAMKRLESR